MKTRREHLTLITPPPPVFADSRYRDSDTLAAALARNVADDLRAAIAQRGQAKLALSGGSTPLRFLQALSREVLDWSRVLVLPVDERWVPSVHKRSNERLLRDTLLQNKAATARLLPLFRPVATPERALQAVMTQVALQALPLDVVVLGMGEDGHIASLFPDLVRRDIGLQPNGRAPVLAVRTTAAPEARMTLTLSAIFTAPALYLHIEGDAKRRVFDTAIDDARSRLPVRALLAQAPVAPRLFWCPDAAQPQLAPSPACGGRLGWGHAVPDVVESPHPNPPPRAGEGTK
ncbi:MAG TPA: 6-phosphogluconolactonase [Lysobacter sp.]|jgi:6-phosphogluconolactonase|nr:6-phosphogluconolactonase [Lysobacter sp.]